ncbi:hypothetical protein [Streptomyces peucetius]|uniref:Uncharacterized protein n=1 Tax=Streptomyces peucetius TaxID=1950 RepID=A0ABY6IJ92_STRPE|nr:hypothetical protein [Streptomyces peucetius]UYQ66819.1 hypothetical protein OGH68_32215 [Streptomyces peucetius]
MSGTSYDAIDAVAADLAGLISEGHDDDCVRPWPTRCRRRRRRR